MSIRRRIFLLIFLPLILGLWYLTSWMSDDLKPRYLESMEETLIDTSHVLADQLGTHWDGHSEVPAPFRNAVAATLGRPINALVYDLKKESVDLRLYATDTNGVVRFDSNNGAAVGNDYSRWNDVVRTLRGEYGARASRDDPGNPNSLRLYVAAPVFHREQLIGVLTVSKAARTSDPFVAAAKRKLLVTAVGAAMVLALIAWVTTIWVTHPLARLTAYTRKVRDGQRATLPDLGRGEVAHMGEALEEMRQALEGKEYVEHYVQTLTHQVKSPLTAIRGAAELLQEDSLPPDRRERFLANLLAESDRLQQIVDQMLLLAALEKQEAPHDPVAISIAEAVATARQTLETKALAKNIIWKIDVPADLTIHGEAFLIQQALLNLLDNAIDFSPPGGVLHLHALRTADGIQLTLRDEGPGLPDFAINRVYERFYSLPREEGGRKSSGLGLSLVKEVTALHRGHITLANHPSGGCLATWRLPP